jgi:hypothetical protein
MVSAKPQVVVFVKSHSFNIITKPQLTAYFFYLSAGCVLNETVVTRVACIAYPHHVVFVHEHLPDLCAPTVIVGQFYEFRLAWSLQIAYLVESSKIHSAFGIENYADKTHTQFI